MSSTDRAPEPTMEEILASIRRIISEEENNDAAHEVAAEADRGDEGRAQPAAQPEQGAPAAQADAPAPEAEAPADAEFTEETIEELTIAVEPEEPASVEEDEILELGDMTGEPPAQHEAEAAAPDVEAPPPPPAPEEPVAEDEPLELAEDVSFPFQEEEDQNDTGEALVRETSALEAAIAALKGDQARAAEEGADSPEPPAQHANEGESQAETPFPAEQSASEPSLEMALQEAAAEEDDGDLEFDEPDPDPEDDEILAENAAAFGAYASERRNGAGQHRETADFGYVAAGGSLEETVKEMLRPMLREWLDQNMDRLLQEALHEELQAEAKPHQN